MSDTFYKAFEEKFRGSRDLIRTRINAFIPFITPLEKLYPGASAVDLGCGRGEWLEVLQKVGFLPVGIDLDGEMLQDCKELNMSVRQGDGISYLAGLPDESLVLISAFHVAEHLTFDQLRKMVEEAVRVLKPGGLLIMETPNPENLVVATRNFYLDPTHHHPLPPELLSFLPEYYGFARSKILRLQEASELVNKESPALADVLAGVSPDYAVIAQKNAPFDSLGLFDQAFGEEYGISLDTIVERFDERLNAFGRNIPVEWVNNYVALKIAAEKKEQELAEQKKVIEDQVTALAERQKLLEASKQELHEIYRSKSWKSILFLRFIKQELKKIGREVKNIFRLVKVGMQKVLRRISDWLRLHPKIKNRLLQYMRKCPGLEVRLRQMARDADIGEVRVMTTGKLSEDVLLGRIRLELEENQRKNKID